MIKKKIILFCLVAIILFGFASSVFALNWPVSPGPGGTKLCPTVPADGCPGPKPSTLTEMIEYFYRWAIVLGGLAAFVVLLYAGFQYLTSAGDPGKTKDARDRITSAIGGLALLLASFILLNIVNPELTGLSALSRDKLKGRGIFDFTMGREFRKVGIPSCEKVIVYKDEDFKSLYKEFRPGEIEKSISPKLGSVSGRRLGSLEIIGNCTVLLYPTSDGTGDAATFPLSTPNLSVTNPDGFGSLRVISNIDASPVGAPILTFNVKKEELGAIGAEQVNIQPGEKVILSWGIGGSGFESCQTQSDPSTDQWDNKTVVDPATPGQKVISDLPLGNHTFFLTCSGAKDKRVFNPQVVPKKVTVSVTGQPLTKEDLPTVELTIKGDALNNKKDVTVKSSPSAEEAKTKAQVLDFPSDFTKEFVTFTWQASANAATCQGADKLAGSKGAPTGTARLSIGGEILPGPQTYTISCKGKVGGEAFASIRIIFAP